MKNRNKSIAIKKTISNIIIVFLVIANIIVGMLNVNIRKPKCISDACNRVRVTGSHYCDRHTYLIDEREICLKVTIKSSN